MKKAYLLSILVAVTLLMISGCASKQLESPPKLVAEQTGNITANMPAQSFTMEEVAKHSSASDCWMAISGKVYDVTKYIGSHPGGDMILQGCGKEATSMIEAKPAHSSGKSQDAIASSYIGEVV